MPSRPYVVISSIRVISPTLITNRHIAGSTDLFVNVFPSKNIKIEIPRHASLVAGDKGTLILDRIRNMDGATPFRPGQSDQIYRDFDYLPGPGSTFEQEIPFNISRDYFHGYFEAGVEIGDLGDPHCISAITRFGINSGDF